MAADQPVEGEPRGRGRRFRIFLLLLLVLLGLLCLQLARQVWRGSGALPSARMPEPEARQRILVFAPHEDDETLGCGGYIQRAVAAGAEVRVCLLTHGEGEELGATWADRSLPLTGAEFVELGLIRQGETCRALRRFGVPADHIQFLGYPNNGLDNLWSAENWDPRHLFTSRYLRSDHSPYPGGTTPSAPYCGAQLLSDVRAVLRQVRPAVVLTVHPADVHRDHWPTYCFVRLALSDLAGEKGQEWTAATSLYTYLIHYPAWPVPWGYEPQKPLAPPAALAGWLANRWMALPLSAQETRLKASTIETYSSQMGRLDRLLHSFARTNELFATVRDVPARDSGRATEQSWSREPVGDTRDLRERPYADLASVSVSRAQGWIRVEVMTVGPLSDRAPVTVVLHVPTSTRRLPRIIQVTCQPSQAHRVLLADDTERLASQDQPLAQAFGSGNKLVVRFPEAALEGGGCALVDALTRERSRCLDHAATRTISVPSRTP